MSDEKGNKNIGARNLAILSFSAIVLAVIAVVVSVIIYVESGDIFLDRSRPGYISENDDQTESENSSGAYTFNDYGNIDREVMDEFLRELDNATRRLESLDAFSNAPLEDGVLF